PTATPTFSGQCILQTVTPNPTYTRRPTTTLPPTHTPCPIPPTYPAQATYTANPTHTPTVTVTATGTPPTSTPTSRIDLVPNMVYTPRTCYTGAYLTLYTINTQPSYVPVTSTMRLVAPGGGGSSYYPV